MMKYLFAACAGALLLTACQSGKDTPQDAVSLAQQSSYYQSVDQMINIDGVDIRFRDEGPKDTHAIVMVHGFTASLETWDALTENLKPDYRVIRFDLPGHGLSGEAADGDYSNAKTAELLQAFLEAQNIERPTIIGNSLGGLAAWRLAALSRESVSNLVLISPGGFSINGVTETPVDVPMMVKFYLTKAPEAGVRQAGTALYGDPAKFSDTRLKTMVDMMKQPGNGDAFVTRAAQFTLPDPTEDLKKVTVPTLIIWGDKDIMVPPAQGPQFTALMPSATLLSYEGVGHVPQEETPQKLADDIRQFLTENLTP